MEEMRLQNRGSWTLRGKHSLRKYFLGCGYSSMLEAEGKEPVERQTGSLNKGRKQQKNQSSKLSGWYGNKNESGSGHFRKKGNLCFPLRRERRNKKDRNLG